MQQGMADHRIWHNELCKADGTDRDASVDENGQAHIAVDNGYTLYVNAVEIGSSEDWTTTDSYAFVAACDAPTVYAIDAYDTGGVASVIGDFSHW